MTRIAILGAGPAGLSVAYYAKKQSLPFQVYEASNRVGGNCVTLSQGEFRFDSGAHRLHDKYPDVTKEIQNLLGTELRKVDAPSQIYHDGRFIDFPLSPLNLLVKLGFFNCAKSGFELIQSRLKNRKDESFESFAIEKYGKSLAERFLLGYSEKLWGAPCKELSPDISGSRMKGLQLKTFLIEAIFGRYAKTEHLDGAFYYPKMGYGRICEELAAFCGVENIRTECKVTKIFHHGRRIEAVELNDSEQVEIDTIVNTLPLNLFVSIMDPPVDPEVQKLADDLRFRSLILVALFLNRASITPNASLYFPDRDCPFTRVYEPKNRSEFMSPAGQTSLVAEVPCDFQDALWNRTEKELVAQITGRFAAIFQIRESEIINSRVIRIRHAYPILRLGFEGKVKRLLSVLDDFENLENCGRSGKFAYSHLHDMMKSGKELVDDLVLRIKKERDPRTISTPVV